MDRGAKPGALGGSGVCEVKRMAFGGFRAIVDL